MWLLGCLSDRRFEICGSENDKNLPKDFKDYWNSPRLCHRIIEDDFLHRKARIIRKIHDGEQFPNSHYCGNYSNFVLPAPSSTNKPSQEFENAVIQFLTIVMTKTTDLQGSPVLVQFWAPVRDGQHNVLTVRDQPFAICSLDEGLFRYRMMCEKYTFSLGDGLQTDENDLGLPGRVFLCKLPECSPNVEYYFSKEYPQRDDALRCQISATSAVPVLDSSCGTCVGVLEFTTTLKPPFNFLQYLPCHNSTVKLESDARAAAVQEINEALRLFSDTHKICCAQAWAFCKVCEGAVDGNTDDIRRRGQLLSVIESACSGPPANVMLLSLAPRRFHTVVGHGVVGTAALCHNPVFCRDVTQFSLAEYPFAHYARSHGLKGCFGIYLSSSYFGSFVLEIFISESYTNSTDPENLLRKMLETLKQSFQTFKSTCAEDLTKDLPIKVIDFHYGVRFEYVLEPKNFRQDGVDAIGAFPSDLAREEIMGALPFDQLPLNFVTSLEGESIFEELSSILDRPYDVMNVAGANQIQATLDGEVRMEKLLFGHREKQIQTPREGGGGMEALQGEMLFEDSTQILNPTYHPTNVAGANQIQGALDGELRMETLPFDQRERQIQAPREGEERMETLPFDQQPTHLVTPFNVEGLVKQVSQVFDPRIGLANVASGEQDETVCTHLKPKGLLKKSLKRPQKKTGFQVGLEDLKRVAELKAPEAAKSLKVSISTFKRICREFNIERWPPRGVILHESTSSALSSQQSHQISDVTTVGDANVVTIKAKYVNGLAIKFQLSLSSGLVDLQQQVAKRLKLEPEDYYLNYKDKDDQLILLACDEDLLDCVSTFKSKTWVELLLVPRKLIS